VIQVLGAIAVGVPTVLLSLHLFNIWRDPFKYGKRRGVRGAVALFIMEFIILHSGAATASIFKAKQGMGGMLGAMLALAAIYGVFVIAISAAFGGWDLFVSTAILMGGRAASAALFMSEKDVQWLLANSIVGVCLYMLTTIVSIFPLPKWGMQGEKMRGVEAPPGSGHWVEYPHRCVGAAAIYYLLLGLFEMLVLSWVDPAIFI